MAESEGEPSARFNHILAPVGGKSYLLGGETDNFKEVYERNRIAGVLRIFDHSAKQWEADHDISKSGNEKPLGVRTGGFVSGEKVIRWARRHGLREIQHSKKVNANIL